MFAIILIVATCLRFYQLDVRPLHHDESVHAWFSYYLNLNTYIYDPTYHGPFQFYLTRAIFSIAGASDFTARLLPALFGVILVALTFGLRKQLGRTGYLTLAFLLATSPSMLYYSRFFRNDIYIATFSLAILICALKYVESHKAIYLYLAAIAAALSLASKENAYITLFIFLSFALLYLVNARYNLKAKINLILFGESDGTKPLAFPKLEFKAIAFAFLIAAAVYSLLLSNFFFKIDNLLGIESFDPIMRLPAPLRAISTWILTHSKGRISGPFYYYLPFLFLYELPIVIFAITGSLYYLKNKDLFMIFTIYWAMSSFLIYSYIQEKVPWLVLHILLPQCIIAAGYIGRGIEKQSRKTLLIFLILMVFFIYSSINLNYVNSYNPQEPLVYVQTSGDVKGIMNKIQMLSNNSRHVPITIATSDYWPFPWYLREYTNVNYGGNYYHSSFIIASELEAIAMEKELSVKGYQKEEFNLREWHVFQIEDVTLDFLLFRRVNTPNGALRLIFFYKG
ncbi:MAG: TIGR03663 family protein [Halobacteria archaeon]